MILKKPIYINHMDLPSNDNQLFADETLERIINRLESRPPRTTVRDSRQSPSQSDEETTQDEENTQDEEDDKNKCCICYESKSDLETIVSECGHVHCSKCFFEWLKTSRTCSMCRNDFGKWDNLNDDIIESMLTVVQKMYKKEKTKYRHMQRKIIHLDYKKEKIELHNLALFQQQIRLNNMINYTKGYHEALKNGNNQTSPIPCCGEYRRGYVEGMYKFNKDITNELKDFFGCITTKKNSKPIKLIKREIKKNKSNDSSDTSDEPIEEYSEDVEEEEGEEDVEEENRVLPATVFHPETVNIPSPQSNIISPPTFVFRGSEGH